MRADRSSTIGTERLTNYALQIASREEFVRELTSKVPVRPEYFLQDAEINREGAAALSELPKLTPVSPEQLKALIEQDAIALDVRPASEFAVGHVPGSVNIALSGQFASWAGALLGLACRPILIADTPEQLSEAQLRMARVGIEGVQGYLDGGPAAWRQAGLPLSQLQEISVETLHEKVQSHKLHLIDVRREGEWKSGHIDGADWLPLDDFRDSALSVGRDAPIAVHCKSGYRSAIACSLLQRAGYTNVTNVLGGFDAWQAAKLPVLTEQTVEA
jgi:rhodanese-related sulfurtransferase